jgi:hypothetical protein
MAEWLVRVLPPVTVAVPMFWTPPPRRAELPAKVLPRTVPLYAVNRA